MVHFKTEFKPNKCLEEGAMPKCAECNDTGIIDTGNNDLPCDCPAGATALFSVTGMGRTLKNLTGAEVQRHFLFENPFRGYLSIKRSKSYRA